MCLRTPGLHLGPQGYKNQECLWGQGCRHLQLPLREALGVILGFVRIQGEGCGPLSAWELEGWGVVLSIS